MISIKIKAGDLDRLLQNALLFSDEKAMRLNEVLLVFSGNELQIFACDDYVGITDIAPLEEGRSFEQTFSISDIKKLAEWVKKDKKIIHKYDIILRQKFTGMLFECDETSSDEESDNIFFSDIGANYDAWDILFSLLSEENDVADISDFIIRPERLSKLWRLSANKEAPIALRGVIVEGHLVIQFKKGDLLKGVIMPVEREYVKEEFLWPNIDQ